MKRMYLEKEFIGIDYTEEGVPESVKNFRPDVYLDREEYCAIPGNDEHAIVGCGASISLALWQWETAYWRKRYGYDQQ